MPRFQDKVAAPAAKYETVYAEMIVMDGVPILKVTQPGEITLGDPARVLLLRCDSIVIGNIFPIDPGMPGRLYRDGNGFLKVSLEE